MSKLIVNPGISFYILNKEIISDMNDPTEDPTIIKGLTYGGYTDTNNLMPSLTRRQSSCNIQLISYGTLASDR